MRSSSIFKRVGWGILVCGLTGLVPKPVHPPAQDTGAVLRIEQIPLLDHPTFEVGDIVVKPNLDWLPGSSGVAAPFNYGFGHAVLVIGNSPTHEPNRLLCMQGTPIIEAQSRDVAQPWQVRTSLLWLPSADTNSVNDSFGEGIRGYRFRLRLSLSEAQKRRLLANIKAQDNDYFSWRSLKKIPSLGRSPDNRSWYCSLLVWYSFYQTIGIDLDANQGWYVYPNDLINSAYFRNTPSDTSRIVRF